MGSLGCREKKTSQLPFVCKFLGWFFPLFVHVGKKTFLNFIFALKKLKKTPQKVAYLWQLGGFFFSAAPTAQNSPELHFCFIKKIFYTTISSRISGYKVLGRSLKQYWLKLGLYCLYLKCMCC